MRSSRPSCSTAISPGPSTTRETLRCRAVAIPIRARADTDDLDALRRLLVRKQSEDDPVPRRANRLTLVEVDLPAVAEVPDPPVVVERLAVPHRIRSELANDAPKRAKQRRREAREVVRDLGARRNGQHQRSPASRSARSRSSSKSTSSAGTARR